MAENPNDKPTSIGNNWTVQRYVIRTNQRFVPPADVIETSESIVVLVEIAGMRGEDFRIALHNQRLIISGVRQRPEVDATAYHQVEIGAGEFRLSVPIPWSIEEEGVTASYRNGFLRVDLPRQKAQRVHIVDVNTSED